MLDVWAEFENLKIEKLKLAPRNKGGVIMRYALQVIFVLSLALLAAACVPKTQLNKAVLKLESEWKAQNDNFLQSEGRRFFKAS